MELKRPYIKHGSVVRIDDVDSKAIVWSIDTDIYRTITVDEGHEIITERHTVRPSAIVVNRHKSEFNVYIGRGTVYGNPQGTVQDYIDYLQSGRSFLTDETLLKLAGKVLGCSCKPKDCHGDILVGLLDALIDQHWPTWTA